ncbi:DUF4097 family beta strand repeat-containing protein [Mucilaginibacter ginsenosidivorans]|uniref:DUF4097 domain-containing protein n=1 Tax=Mucilaginibacter ginsenosidivorans TaxID=398053 RepID=A0A5B8V001_9SPHI|nr:DUF4097 family beta strand repeat-containing protein [Mucilaginibacter ginsenosidivorans]QEC64153.1 DUF4097 domain-containing protein [Mucilaginibacter ginsenosidivorans]
MKKYLILFIAACQGLSTLAQDNKTPYITKSLTNAGIKNVYVSTSGGSITVSGAPGEEPRIEVYVSGNNGLSNLSKDEIKKRLEENYTLDITTSGGELKAVAKNKHDHNWDWRRSLNIGFKVYVPQNVATKLETSGGSIHLDNLSGQEVFETSGGSLHIDKLTGNIRGRTSGGSITLMNSKDNIDLETSGGSIRASNCSGNIHLETSGGSIRLEDLNGKIGAETSGGSVAANNIKGELKTGTSGGSINLTGLACSLDTYTSGGSIHAQLKEASKFVKIDASGGHVDLELPSKQGFDLNLRADKVTAELGGGSFNGTKEKDRVEGKLNGGGISVDVNGSNRVNLTLN